MTTVYVAVPCLGWVRVELAHALRQISHDGRYELEWADPIFNMRPLSAARHSIINRFLASEADWLLMFDNDAVPYANPLDLVEHDLDIVAMACPIWRQGASPPVVLNVTPLDGTMTVNLDADGPLLEVSQTSTSAILVARRVLEHPDMKNPFGAQFGEDGTTIADDDVRFYRRARAAGFKVWVSLDHICGHVKDVDVMALAQAVKEWR
jgi:hypothetical protein